MSPSLLQRRKMNNLGVGLGNPTSLSPAIKGRPPGLSLASPSKLSVGGGSDSLKLGLNPTE